MKKFKLFIGAFICTLALNSCSSDGNGDSSTAVSVKESDLIGKWYLKETLFPDGDVTNDDDFYMQILANHVLKYTYTDFGAHGEDITETGTWSLSGSNFKVVSKDADAGNETSTYKITTINSTTLKWTFKDGNENIVETYTK